MKTRSRIFVAFLLFALASPLLASGPATGADEAIGVSGHWVVEVREPDGTPVMRREFHNALSPGNPITRFLTGERTAGPFQIVVQCGESGTTCAPPCPVGACFIVEPRLTLTASASLFKNLIVSSGVNGLQLRGSAVVSADTTIALFLTQVFFCPITVAPGSCVSAPAGGGLATLTSTVLSPPVAVATGQQVLITVTITLATAAAPPPTTSASVVPSR